MNKWSKLNTDGQMRKTDYDFGTSWHTIYTSATHYLFLNLISRHFTSAITWTSNTGPLVAPLIASDNEYAGAELISILTGTNDKDGVVWHHKPTLSMVFLRFSAVKGGWTHTQTQYSPNSTWLVTSRHDSTRSTCKAHAFWLCGACRTAWLDTLDTSSSTGSTRSDTTSATHNLVCCVICIKYDT